MQTLIIALDESKPEESEAVIADLNSEEQIISPKYHTKERNYSPITINPASDDKQFGYALLTPEEVKQLGSNQNYNGLKKDNPKFLSYPVGPIVKNPDVPRHSSSPEPYELSYPVGSSKETGNYYDSPRGKYPERPAPPLPLLSSNNSLADKGNYVGSSSLKYNSPNSNPYVSYGSGEPVQPIHSHRGSENTYDNSKYGDSSYSSPISSYNTAKEHIPLYQPSYLPQNEHNPYSKAYDYPQENSQELAPLKPSNPSTYRKYQSPQELYVPKLGSSTNLYPPKSHSSPRFKYYTNPKIEMGYPATYATDLSGAKPYRRKFKNNVPQQPVSEYRNPTPELFNPHKDIYVDKSSAIPPTSYSNQAYGTRTKHAPETTPYSDVRSKSTYQDEPADYASKEKPYADVNTYNSNYASEPHIGKQPPYEVPSSHHTYADSKLTYAKNPDTLTYKAPQSSFNSYDYPITPVRSQSSGTLHDASKYSSKPDLSLRSKTPKQDGAYDSSYDRYGSRKYPVSYDSPSSIETYDSKPHSSYRGSSEVDNPTRVTKFYHAPSYSSQTPSRYSSKYSESDHDLPKSAYYDSSKSSKYPADEETSPKDTSYYPSHKNDGTYGKSSIYDKHRGYETSSEIRDNHSVNKNYKPSRPAPLYDEYEQPRYPPLPVNLKDSSEKYSEYEKSVEKPFKNKKHEKSPESSYSSSYDPATYKSPYSYDTSNKHYPLPNEPGSQKNQYSGSSSKEVDYQPEVKTKTYSKPYYGSDEVNYHGDNSYETGPKSPGSNESPAYTYNSPNDKPLSYQSNPSTYSNTHSYSEPAGSSEEYPPSKSSDNTEKKFRYYTENDKPESSHNTYLAEPERPKRVEGVVYRSRKTYPDLQSPRSQKSYLPYKLYNPGTAPAVDYKVYENAPDKNLSESPRKKTIKLKYKPLKKDSYQESIKDTSAYDNSYEGTGFSNIPGEAGKDFPILKAIPYTHFSCENRAPGFYADIEHRCQVYYQCSDKGRIQSFLCPNGTIFNQETFVCEWWHNVDCSKSEKFFVKNNDLYKPNLPTSSEQVEEEKYPPSARSRDYKEYPVSDEYSGNYTPNDDVKPERYAKTPRNRRRIRSKVTYTHQ
ncbi:chitin-binding type-2 domain-containing protein [Caerostris darwini]|uniref:Chitin-binding type-2 domain-containing protein n=1 Tax=Caerostris darwini TaxID=1538125 RepID=A0AAV4UP80_9ARAC|nr:chitin-binding type-2 domain-containing protein [Caerostris darwini]